jgi:filamentous hemagglutinin family protein
MFVLKHGLSCLLLTSIITSISGAYAQSITTGANGLNTNVNQVGNQYNITGGTLAGGNLFYSLQKLGLSTGEIANFLSNPNVLNVLTRVTGGEASLINGLIQVTGGNSNLFILNPAGIVFGANASLNVPASFSATTATGIKVGSGWFGINSTVDEVRNLTGNVTGYAFTNTLPSMDTNPSGVIVNEGNLSVSAGKTVTLVGGIVVNTGTIATPSGKITIAATPDNKFIKITSEGSLISLELPIADRQAVGNAPILQGVDLPSLLTGKTVGTAIVSGTLNADALANGNGGNVNIFAENTKFDGLISARGGTAIGNGGFVEVSAKQKLSYSGLVDLRATKGLTGNLLIDPATFVIATTGGDITPTAVAAQWNLANTTYAATTSLTVTDAVAANSTNTLALDAPTINLNAAITNTGSGALLGTATTVNVGALGTVQNGVDVAASGATVNLAAAIYTLGATVLINKNLTLNGTGANNTIVSGNSFFQVFDIGNNSTINMNGLTISDGFVNGTGGGILVNTGSTLNLSNSNFSNNSADLDGGGVYVSSGAVLNLTNSDFSNNSANGVAINGGGAIRNFGATTVANSSFTNNSAFNYGGAIYTGGGTLNVIDSMFTGNRGSSGAIDNSGGSKSIISNSTFSGNTARSDGGAISNYTGTVSISNSTFFNNSATDAGANGGAIRNFLGAITISNSILVGNTAPNGNEVFLDGGMVNFTGANIVGTNGLNGITGASTGTPITPTGAANTVINTTLADNGGATKTHALVKGSIAIDASSTTGSAIPTASDQRGIAANGIRDIGAFEVAPPLPVVVPPVVISTVVTTRPDIDPNKETRQNDEKKVLVLSSLTPIAFLSTDDIEFQRLDRFLIVIIEFMNKDGGDLAIDTKDIWKDANISIFDQSANQDVIRLAIHRSIGKFIGNEYIELVDVKFDTKKDKKTILLKVRKIGKALKPAKFLKD